MKRDDLVRVLDDDTVYVILAIDGGMALLNRVKKNGTLDYRFASSWIQLSMLAPANPEE